MGFLLSVGLLALGREEGEAWEKGTSSPMAVLLVLLLPPSLFKSLSFYLSFDTIPPRKTSPGSEISSRIRRQRLPLPLRFVFFPFLSAQGLCLNKSREKEIWTRKRRRGSRLAWRISVYLSVCLTDRYGKDELSIQELSNGRKVERKRVK